MAAGRSERRPRDPARAGRAEPSPAGDSRPGGQWGTTLRASGEVSEWLKELAWKASGRVNRLVGSNPTLSAQVPRAAGKRRGRARGLRARPLEPYAAGGADVAAGGADAALLARSESRTLTTRIQSAA